MPIYEFQCHKGHITEDLVPMSQRAVVCPLCFEELRQGKVEIWHDEPVIGARSWNPMATRILSATRTDFKFADQKLKR